MFFEALLLEELEDNDILEELQLEEIIERWELLDSELLLLVLDFELYEGDREDDELDLLGALEELLEQLRDVELFDSDMEELLELILLSDFDMEELLELWLLSLKDCELEDELLLGDEERELQDELIEASVIEDDDELLLLLDSWLEHGLLDEEEDEIAADQLLLELLLDSEFMDELQLDDKHDSETMLGLLLEELEE